MYWNSAYIILIAISTIIDYIAGKKIYNSSVKSSKKIFLIISMITNLSLLGFFKYYNFVIDNLNYLITFFSNLNFQFPNYAIILPVGISFYTFQTMSYTIDIYRGKLKPANSFIEFSFFVSFFAQLVAGPIVRAKDFLPQIKQKIMDDLEIFDGISLILKGLIKKILFADLLAVWLVDKVFQNPLGYGSIDIIMAVYGYAFQIYFDFSAYSDIAIGTGLLFGYKIPVNFNRPYLSLSPSDFWKRWHISLSQWLRDYLYIPLGGSKVNKKRILINLIITMFLGGLWHGASWNFIIWGLLHGFYLIIYRIIPEKIYTKNNFRLWISRIVFFHLVCFAWIFFRCTSFESLKSFLSAFFQFNIPAHLLKYNIVILILISFITHIISQDFFDNVRLKFIRLNEVYQVIITFLIAGLLMVIQHSKIPFIYFQF